MHIHILGICGTFMGGLAVIAKQLGHTVSGSDLNVYPPMSTQLAEQGITLFEGYGIDQFEPQPDLVIIGNALSRGNEAVEHVLNRNIPFTSGPQWLGDTLLHQRWVLAVAGTHGKTTTSSMLAWILEFAGHSPGFLIGGVPENFAISARLGESPFFVIEADEYDTAFFDKRSKFVHYHPKTVILNNLEYDHADIFPDLASIERQFHHLVRTIPGIGKIVRPLESSALNRVLEQGCWSPVEMFSIIDDEPNSPTSEDSLIASMKSDDGTCFTVMRNGNELGTVRWDHTGRHNVMNALAAIASAQHAGVAAEVAINALSSFTGVKRRMEVRGEVCGVTVYDDFAHHPTAIFTTLQGLRAKVGKQKIIVVLEPRSNTMRMGVHKDSLAQSCCLADKAYWYEPVGLNWGLADVLASADNVSTLFHDIDSTVNEIANNAEQGDHIVVMSNGGFGGIHEKLLNALKRKFIKNETR